MQGGFEINNYLKNCRDMTLKISQAFEKSEFVPKNGAAIATLVKELLFKMMANSSAIKFKLVLSGSISEESNVVDKRCSFTSDISTLLANIQGLLGFEFSTYVMAHCGTFTLINIMLKDMKEAKSYEELLEFTNGYIYRLLKPFPEAKYTFQVTPMNKSKINELALCGDTIDEFFERMASELRQKCAAKNITNFLRDKERIVNEIETFIQNIESGKKIINSVNDLVIPNMERYTVLYTGSFLKLYEILYKSVYADNPKYNETSLAYVDSYTAVERYVDSLLTASGSQQSQFYITMFKEYYTDIYNKTTNALFNDALIEKEIKKMSVSLSMSVITSLAKISLCLFVRMAKLISWKRDVALFSNNSPNRIQHNNIFEALICVPSGLDVDYTLEQLYVIYYILSCQKTIKTTKSKELEKNKSTSKDAKKLARKPRSKSKSKNETEEQQADEA